MPTPNSPNGIPPWNGRRVTTARQRVLERDHGICWLCHHPGANSLDHILPRHTHPHLTWDPTNWKAAHLGTAGNPTGCPTPGCTCIGNIARRDATTAPPSRPW